MTIDDFIKNKQYKALKQAETYRALNSMTQKQREFVEGVMQATFQHTGVVVCPDDLNWKRFHKGLDALTKAQRAVATYEHDRAQKERPDEWGHLDLAAFVEVRQKQEAKKYEEYKRQKAKAEAPF